MRRRLLPAVALLAVAGSCDPLCGCERPLDEVSVRGLATFPGGAPAPGVTVTARTGAGGDCARRNFDHPVVAGADGRYETYATTPGGGTICVWADPLPGSGLLASDTARVPWPRDLAAVTADLTLRAAP